MNKVIWKSRKNYPAKTVLIRSVSYWLLHWRNFKFYWNFNRKGQPSKLHANIQLIFFGFRKNNGEASIRLLNFELSYLW